MLIWLQCVSFTLITPPPTYVLSLLIYCLFLDSFKFEKIVEGYARIYFSFPSLIAVFDASVQVY